ncbi:perlucin-like protein [Montipora foliosa]|uniref:perlucin-like protein n=1 Tax=Montipora foliosa TaxID=591990 RepID=UPI0035F164B6
MFSRKSYAIILCLLIGFSNSQPLNSRQTLTKSTDTQAKQNFVVNNNCGLAQSDRETLALIKSTVDDIAAKTGKGPACPTGWVSHGKSCYIVIDIPTLEWSAARRNCQKLGGDLAKITTNAENQFIFNLVSNQTTTTRCGAWLGLHRKADNKFYWVDDTPLTGYTQWGRGEPNDPTTERCGNMFGPTETRKGMWNDISCNLDKKFLAMAPVILCQKTAN